MSTMLLSFWSFVSGEVSESKYGLVRWISVGAVVALLILVVLLAFLNKKQKMFSTANIATAGVCLAASFGLSFLKFTPVTYGGSVTAASLVPIMLYAYFFGPASGLAVGMIFGLLQFIQSPYLLTPVSFLLDYPLAFASIFWMGFAGKWTMIGEWKRLTIGAALTYATRFIFHLLSGFIYFAHGAIWADLPQSNAFVYSFLYQVTYLIPDMAIAVAVLIALSLTKAISSLEKVIRK